MKKSGKHSENELVVQYLGRIKYKGQLAPTERVLRDLHRSHLYHIPFENFELRKGIMADLKRSVCHEKIVTGKRGGVCLELNVLFAWLLRRIGFKVRMLSVAIGRRSGLFGPDYEHMVLLVNGRWLADVGFGSHGFLDPIPLEAGPVHIQQGIPYRLTSADDYSFILQEKVNKVWVNRYLFDLKPKTLKDFIPTNRDICLRRWSALYHRTVCTRATPKGRLVFLDGVLYRVVLGQKRILLRTDKDSPKVLRKFFKINLDSRRI